MKKYTHSDNNQKMIYTSVEKLREYMTRYDLVYILANKNKYIKTILQRSITQ